MKNIVFILLIVGIFGSAGAGYFAYQNGYLNSLNFLNQEPEQDLVIEADKDIDLINEILNEAADNGTSDESVELPEGTSDISDILPTKGRLPVISSMRAAKLYENAFIRFSHPSYIIFKNETLTFLEIWNEDELIGTINMYSNPENLPIEEFVKKENLIDYFTESVLKGLSYEPFEIPTTIKAFKFSNYPELKVADIYLIEFSGLILVSKDFSEDKVVGEYLLRSIEKTQ